MDMLAQLMHDTWKAQKINPPHSLAWWTLQFKIRRYMNKRSCFGMHNDDICGVTCGERGSGRENRAKRARFTCPTIDRLCAVIMMLQKSYSKDVPNQSRILHPLTWPLSYTHHVLSVNFPSRLSAFKDAWVCIQLRLSTSLPCKSSIEVSSTYMDSDAVVQLYSNSSRCKGTGSKYHLWRGNLFLSLSEYRNLRLGRE